MWILPVIYVGGAIYKFKKIYGKDKHPIGGALLWPLGVLKVGPFQG